MPRSSSPTGSRPPGRGWPRCPPRTGSGVAQGHVIAEPEPASPRSGVVRALPAKSTATEQQVHAVAGMALDTLKEHEDVVPGRPRTTVWVTQVGAESTVTATSGTVSVPRPPGRQQARRRLLARRAEDRPHETESCPGPSRSTPASASRRRPSTAPSELEEDPSPPQPQSTRRPAAASPYRRGLTSPHIFVQTPGGRSLLRRLDDSLEIPCPERRASGDGVEVRCPKRPNSRWAVR